LFDQELDAQTIFDGLEEFRQHLGGRLTVTMLRAVGQSINVHSIDQVAMKESIEMVRAFSLAKVS
jgi:3-dehydroquinate synthase